MQTGPRSFRVLYLAMSTTVELYSEQQQSAPAQERRGAPRRSVPKLLIAYHAHQSVPPGDRFVEVEGGDLSPGGFSFYTVEPPAGMWIVVRIAAGTVLTHAQARVRWIHEIQRNGRSMYAAGCEFTTELLTEAPLVQRSLQLDSRR